MKSTLLVLALLGAGLAVAQQKAKPAVVPPAPPVVVEETVYPLPLELRDKFRDLQHENDALEIDNQKMLVKIEQNKARQSAIVDQETEIASQFGRDKNLDLAKYELDPSQVALRRKKTK